MIKSDSAFLMTECKLSPRPSGLRAVFEYAYVNPQTFELNYAPKVTLIFSTACVVSSLCVCVYVSLKGNTLKPIQALLSSLRRQEGWRLPKMTYSKPQRHYLNTQATITNTRVSTLIHKDLLLCAAAKTHRRHLLAFHMRPCNMQTRRVEVRKINHPHHKTKNIKMSISSRKTC